MTLKDFLKDLKKSEAFLTWQTFIGPRLNKKTKNPQRVLTGITENCSHMNPFEAVYKVQNRKDPLKQGYEAAKALGFNKKHYRLTMEAVNDLGTQDKLRQIIMKELNLEEATNSDTRRKHSRDCDRSKHDRRREAIDARQITRRTEGKASHIRGRSITKKRRD